MKVEASELPSGIFILGAVLHDGKRYITVINKDNANVSLLNISCESTFF